MDRFAVAEAFEVLFIVWLPFTICQCESQRANTKNDSGSGFAPEIRRSWYKSDSSHDYSGRIPPRHELLRHWRDGYHRR
jgi:hypothetical protein